MLTASVKLDTSGLEKLGRDWQPALKKAVDKGGEEVAADARSRAHVITGSMRESTGVVSELRPDDFAQRQARAKALNPKAVLVEAPPRPAGFTAIVACGVEHGQYEEYGTRHRPPHPWFTAAAEYGRRELPGLVAQALRKIL